ncbi:MAG: hypothetical protein WC372_04005 [Candidatus Neomarinimicrobiota bacterium]|jgi:hypothetical protein|nr:hypothetical protein [Candidatus Neomarinimicrobiota bacterium]MDD3965837.1 hypothetical protein [Candidatus Neomarinimicrobiota bacterium]MDX9779710.1 hypothetical protein [bacterium]
MNQSIKYPDHDVPSLWFRIRFYIIIFLLTGLLLALMMMLNHAAYLRENAVPAMISMLNALTAYIIAKRKEKNAADYKKIMKHVYIVTLARYIFMTSLILILILGKFVEALPFIFSFIAFYVLHQIIVIRILQLETK